MSFIIYIEGGGDRNHHLETFFRRAWRSFFEKAGFGSAMPRIVRGGARNRTFELFSRNFNNLALDRLPLLLVDSENKVKKSHSVWEHLQTQDGWRKPSGAGDEHAFLMVQAMDTWLLADRAALQKYFDRGFRENAIKQWPELEEVPKTTIIEALRNATTNCSKQYAKGKVSFELLQHINPSHVEAKCPHFKALLTRLRGL